MEIQQALAEAIQCCIDALNHPIAGTQQVIGDGAMVWATLHNIAQRPDQGHGLGLFDYDYDGERGDFDSCIRQYKTHDQGQIDCSLDWLHAIVILYDAIDFDEQQIIDSAQSIQNDIIFNHIVKHVVSNCVVQQDISAALQFIRYFRRTHIFYESDSVDLGYLILLKYYALRADVDQFFKYFKLSKPSRNRYELAILKGILVEKFSSQNNIADVLKLCKHKNIGAGFYYNALLAYADQGQYSLLKTMFRQHPELIQADKATDVHVLIRAYAKAKQLDIEVEDDFELLFDRVTQIGRKLRWGDVKLQDSLLYDLGMADFDHQTRRIRCRKAIKDNRIKKEMDHKPMWADI
ncbi:hypothetical protein EC844_12166 [Acinetobacter calcoaceticus]|uniref:Uncharacterized protein n=1 Tax=Acinetobacter calcoaceticus TaxID=471 RepID=A0A4R1XJZ7_ACICA|nr:hypothetical protein EC844_12166 [Acinetobacter calcoaceticus]